MAQLRRFVGMTSKGAAEERESVKKESKEKSDRVSKGVVGPQRVPDEQHGLSFHHSKPQICPNNMRI